jgi:hypothetical protein
MTDEKKILYLKAFETIECEECGGSEDLLFNKYKDTHICQTCLNFEISRIERETEDAKEDDYRDSNYNELLAERAL